jgi:hypothetical protein
VYVRVLAFGLGLGVPRYARLGDQLGLKEGLDGLQE